MFASRCKVSHIMLHREIMNFFDGINIMPNGIHIVVGATNRPTGEAFVEFTSSDEAQCGMDVAAKTLGLTTENCSGQPKGSNWCIWNNKTDAHTGHNNQLGKNAKCSNCSNKLLLMLVSQSFLLN